MATIPAQDTATGPTITWWRAAHGTGTPVVWSDEADVSWAYFGAQHPRTVCADVLSPAWVKRLLAAPATARELSGVFSLFVIDKSARSLIVAGDRLGVQAVHYAEDARRTWRISTHLTWLLLSAGHDGGVDRDGFASHMAFGYAVEPYRAVYAGVRVLPPAGYLRVDERGLTSDNYWVAPEPGHTRLEDANPLVEALQTATSARTTGGGVFLGLTAGKDSLCLASTALPETVRRSGTLGVPDCADQLQAARVAELMQWPHVQGSVCASSDFFTWADEVAFQSAGLATTSYVDMAAFVGEHVGNGETFVMGEGGECVRDFFGSSQRPALDTLRHDYMTPRDYLRHSLATEWSNSLSEYPDGLIADLRTATGERDDEHFVSYFYRCQRMPGNFALRHAVLSALRPKLSPFLDSRFIDATYALSPAEHHQSGVHHRIIAAARPALLPFFEHPWRSARSTQDWPTRYPLLAPAFRAALARDLVCSDDAFDPRGVLRLADEAARQPSRAIFHLFRVFSFVRARVMLRRDAARRLRAIELEAVGPIPVAPR
jgi:hypothetical protein